MNRSCYKCIHLSCCKWTPIGKTVPLLFISNDERRLWFEKAPRMYAQACALFEAKPESEQ